MKTPSNLPQNLPSQMGRFLVVGMVVAAIDLAVFMILVWLRISPVFANAAAMTAGFCAGLFGHHYFTFATKQALAWPVAVRYAVGFGFNLLLGGVTLEVLMRLGANAFVAKLVAMAVVVISNFVLSRQFVFRRR